MWYIRNIEEKNSEPIALGESIGEAFLNLNPHLKDLGVTADDMQNEFDKYEEKQKTFFEGL